MSKRNTHRDFIERNAAQQIRILVILEWMQVNSEKWPSDAVATALVKFATRRCKPAETKAFAIANNYIELDGTSTAKANAFVERYHSWLNTETP